jgi:hypothetical protein
MYGQIRVCGNGLVRLIFAKKPDALAIGSLAGFAGWASTSFVPPVQTD